MFPVMLWGAVILRKRYSWRDAGLALAITAGAFMFFSLGPTASRCTPSGRLTLMCLGFALSAYVWPA